MEELKLILEVVRGAGEGAYSIAIIYFIKEYLEMVFIFTGFMIPVILGYKFGLMAWKAYSYSRQILNIFGLSYPYYPSDWKTLMEKLRAIKSEKSI